MSYLIILYYTNYSVTQSIKSGGSESWNCGTKLFWTYEVPFHPTERFYGM